MRKQLPWHTRLFEGSGIHHSNSGLQITHDMYISGYFILLFDLTPDLAASEGQTSPWKVVIYALSYRLKKR